MATHTGQIVTPDTFVRAETDRYFHDIAARSGGVNRLFHFRRPTPLDEQTVVRMNRDTLYSMGVVDTSAGARMTVPDAGPGRYVSVYLADNDHYVPEVIYEPGVHALPEETRYLAVGVRIQVFDPQDEQEIAGINALQDRFAVEADSADPLPEYAWDDSSLTELRSRYEQQFARIQRYPDDWQGPRGTVNERTRHLAAAGAWGLFPNQHATYINYSSVGLPPSDCHVGIYEVPENDAFWSITVYGADGYMKSDRCVVNAANTVMNSDGTFTVHFGSGPECGEVANRVDVTEGWNFLMRIYRPGPTVLDGTYRLPEVEPV